MKTWTSPTTELVNQFIELSHKPENCVYFFTRLENPEWIEPLWERGFFTDPPRSYIDCETKNLTFPRWPEGVYLARMAPLAPDAVISVLGSLGPTDNPIVTRHILEAVGSLPDNHLQQISNQITRRFQLEEMSYAYEFAMETVDLVARLIEVEKIDDAITIAEHLLAVRKGPWHAEIAMINLHADLEPIGWLPETDYEDIIEHLLYGLLPQANIKGFKLFSSLLERALHISDLSNEESRVGDFSYIWRPSIGYNELNLRAGIKGTLVSILRDAAEMLSSYGDKELEGVIAELETRTQVHKRIALHTITKSKNGVSLAESRIIRKDLFDDACLKHEYAKLLRQHFGHISPEARGRVLEWISNGPNIDDYIQWCKMWGDPTPSEANIQRYSDSWRRDWYHSILKHLDGEDLIRYHQLTSQIGEPEHEDFLYKTTSSTDPKSPLSEEQLSRRSPQNIINYLQNWQPSESLGLSDVVSVESLGRMLESDVAQRAEEYYAVSKSFIDLDPTYVRHFFAGLYRRLHNKEGLSWHEPLTLAKLAISKPFKLSECTPSRGRDGGWFWCRHQIASLLKYGLSDSDNPIPFELREQVWTLLEELASDPDPSGYTEPYDADRIVDLSISFNPGQAMHAIIAYATWCHNFMPNSGLTPEVKAVLEERFSPNHNPSPVVHSIYGRRLTTLLSLDRTWVQEHLDCIFPKLSELSSLRDAAWSSYLKFSQPLDDLFCILRSEYEAAIQRIAPRDGSSKPRKIDIELGNHLVIFYCREVADYEIVSDYFQIAGDELAGTVMGFVGADLKDIAGELDQTVSKRIQDLWNERRATVQHNVEAHTEEIRAFGKAFTSGKFDDDWALDFLEWAVESVGRPGDGETVVERLVELVSSFPAETTRILTVMLERPDDDWEAIVKGLWRDGAYALVEATAGISDPEVVENRKRIADFYVKHSDGNDQAFRDLIRSAEPAADG